MPELPNEKIRLAKEGVGEGNEVGVTSVWVLGMESDIAREVTLKIGNAIKTGTKIENRATPTIRTTRQPIQRLALACTAGETD